MKQYLDVLVFSILQFRRLFFKAQLNLSNLFLIFLHIKILMEHFDKSARLYRLIQNFLDQFFQFQYIILCMSNEFPFLLNLCI